MSKLHELLAVEGDLDGNVVKVTEEAVVTFSKRADHFSKSERSYLPTAENEPEQPTEYHDITTTVGEKLSYVLESWVKYLDANCQKEATNQVAKADIIIDGNVLVSGLPATALLSFENKFKKLRAMFEVIPTWAPGTEWGLDTSISTEERKIYKAKHPEQKNRSVKTFAHKVLVPPSDKHPAQIEKWEEQVVVGRYTKDIWTGTISVSEKSEYLRRLDILIREIKKARQRANEAEIIKINVAESLINYVMGK